MVRIGTLIVDDQADIRLLVRLAIEAANDGLHVVGEAADGVEALELWAELAAALGIHCCVPKTDVQRLPGALLRLACGHPDC